MNPPNGYFSWDTTALSNALHLPVNVITNMYRDGRKIAYILEERVSHEIKGTTTHEHTPYDVTGPRGHRIEVRCMSKGYSYFCPSSMVGAGREFNEAKFLDKLTEVDAFVFCNQKEFPNVPYWVVTRKEVSDMIASGVITQGRMTSIQLRKYLSSRET